MKESFYLNNEGVSINYLSIDKQAQKTVIVIPGIINCAEDYLDFFRRCDFNSIIISLRGRGYSSAPKIGYSFKKQVSDIISVVKKSKKNKFSVLGHSMGSLFAIEVAQYYSQIVEQLLLIDYPPLCRKLDESWLNDVLAINRKDRKITDETLSALMKESDIIDKREVYGKLKTRIAVIKCENSSYLSEEVLCKMKKLNPLTEIYNLRNTEHDFFSKPNNYNTRVIEKIILRNNPN